jgi:hypothetical protein
MKKYFEELVKVMETEDDWNGYGSKAPNEVAEKNTRFIIDQIMALEKYMDSYPLPEAQISPSAEEGIVISFSDKTRYGFIECFNDGEVYAATSDYNDHIIWEVYLTDFAAVMMTLYKLCLFFKYHTAKCRCTEDYKGQFTVTKDDGVKHWPL